MRRARTLAAAVVAFAAAAAVVRGEEPGGEAPGGEIDVVATPPSAEERIEEIRQRVQDAVVYPQAARERGLEGTARIQFRVDAGGRAAEVITVESSGSRLLDGAAEQAARDARQLPQIFGFVRIPVRFALEPRVAAR